MVVLRVISTYQRQLNNTGADKVLVFKIKSSPVIIIEKDFADFNSANSFHMC